MMAYLQYMLCLQPLSLSPIASLSISLPSACLSTFTNSLVNLIMFGPK